ncbi:MAG: thiosulfohydrolase SoxB [Sutterellaceae bacterium]|nr:thiosulfohydrolase SoxB [Burkholderiaceae bacterium]MDW8430062.1 thiosulfohydrolase SoxB [Sutterellaceae bacterium]
MEVSRRDLLKFFAIAGAYGAARGQAWAAPTPQQLLQFEPLGNVTLLHMTDSHATLLPVYYREPDTLLGIGAEKGKPPYLTGAEFLAHYRIKPGSAEAYALAHLDFASLARRYGPMGGYAHLATLVKRVRAERPGRTLLLDGGDTLQGSATSLWTEAEDMVQVINELGVDVLCPHWEFTFGIERVKQIFGDQDKRGSFKGEFVAHNVMDISWGPPGEPVFKPYVVREVGGARLGIIGQAFPYTPVSHPRKFVPDLSFGIREEQLQQHVETLREREKVDAVVVLSHNGVAVDLKMAGRVRGIDVILGGHTHDGLPHPIQVGQTLVVNSGAHGKFLSRLDLDVQGGRVRAWRYKLIPVLSQYIPADPAMAALIARVRAPYEARLAETLAVSESLLYRRGNFNGTFDEVILDALLKHYDAQVAFSPGFRWGTTVLPGEAITLEQVYAHTALTYPNTWSREMTGEEIKNVMEDVADNLFNPDPYYRQGGDMVRVGGITYTIDPTAKLGSRISDLRIGGQPMQPSKRYKAAGWASMMDVDGPPVFDVVAAHLRREKRIRIAPPTRVKVKA